MADDTPETPASNEQASAPAPAAPAAAPAPAAAQPAPATAPTEQASAPAPAAPAAAPAPAAAQPAPATAPTEQASVGEVIEYVKAYAVQETVGPLKGAGQWIGYGAAGAIALGIGLSLLLLGLLRVLQTEWDLSDTGRLTWLPYLIVLFVCIALLALVISRINKTFLDKEDK